MLHALILRSWSGVHNLYATGLVSVVTWIGAATTRRRDWIIIGSVRTKATPAWKTKIRYISFWLQTPSMFFVVFDTIQSPRRGFFLLCWSNARPVNIEWTVLISSLISVSSSHNVKSKAITGVWGARWLGTWRWGDRPLFCIPSISACSPSYLLDLWN